MATMKKGSARVQTCWKEGLKRDPSMGGEVKVHFVVTHDVYSIHFQS